MRTTAVALAVLLACPAAFADEKSSLACTDFYTYVNDAWLRQAQIAPDRTRASTFEDLREANTQRLSKVLSQVKPGDALLDTPGKRLAMAYYASSMDTAADGVGERDSGCRRVNWSASAAAGALLDSR